MNKQGSGYDATPRVIIVGGGGSGAGARASLKNGKVSGITLVQQGSGYASAPGVSSIPRGTPIGWTLNTDNQGNTQSAGGMGEFALMGLTNFFTGGGAELPAFSLSPSPGTQSASKGRQVRFLLKVSFLNSFNGTVNLSNSIGGHVEHWTSSFTPASTAFGDQNTGTSMLAVTIGPFAASGTDHTVTITGTSGRLVHATTVTVHVN